MTTAASVSLPGIRRLPSESGSSASCAGRSAAAEEAAGRGEVPVGAVVVVGDEIVAVAHNERETASDPTAHAEIVALRRAAAALGSWRLTAPTSS